MGKIQVKPGTKWAPRFGLGPDVRIVKVTARRVTFKPVGEPRALAGSMQKDGFLVGYEPAES